MGYGLGGYGWRGYGWSVRHGRGGIWVAGEVEMKKGAGWENTG